MKLNLITPSRGSLDHEYLQSCEELCELARRSAHFTLKVTRGFGCSLLDHARSRLASDFYSQTDSDVLLWVDDDMVFDADEVLEMSFEAHRRQAIVGAASTTKKPLGELTAHFAEHAGKIAFYDGGQVRKARSIGTGVTAVSRHVFKRLLETYEIQACKQADGTPIFPFYKSLVDSDGLWWGEDTSFCLHAAHAGCDTFIDTRVRVFHKGAYLYALEDIGLRVEHYRTLTLNIQTPVPSISPEQPLSSPLNGEALPCRNTPSG